MLQENYATEITDMLSKYDEKQSAVLPLLYIAQDAYGYLSDEAIRDVAATLDLPVTDIFEVVGFYTLYYERPVGKWMIQVCDDVPCCYCGAEELITTLKEKLGIEEEETTPDGMFTLQRVKCLAACHRPPVVQANLGYVYDVTPEKVDGFLRELRERAERGDMWGYSGSTAEDFDLSPEGKMKLLERKMGGMPERQPPITR
jgi:NADH-quinone oxidoreductase subunit E